MTETRVRTERGSVDNLHCAPSIGAVMCGFYFPRRIRIDAYTVSVVAFFKTLRIGEQVRIRGQRWGTSYQVVGEYLEPFGSSTHWIYGHDLKRDVDLAKGRKFTSGSIVRVEDWYYYIQGWTGLEDGGGLEMISFDKYDSLGLPPTPNTPTRPPTPQEKERMKQHALKVKEKEREQVREAAKKVERENAIDPQDHPGSADVIPVTGTNTLGDLGIYQDSLSDEEVLGIWAGVPFWKRSVQEVKGERLFSKRFEWTSQVENRAGGIEAASQGVAKSREESEQAIGEHMTDLAIEFLKKRDLAIAQAAKFGVLLEASRPPFQYQEVFLEGFEGYGIIAKFRDTFMPFVHISSPFDFGEIQERDSAEMFLLVLFVVTGDEEHVRELMNVQAERRQFRELMRWAKLRRG